MTTSHHFNAVKEAADNTRREMQKTAAQITALARRYDTLDARHKVQSARVMDLIDNDFTRAADDAAAKAKRQARRRHRNALAKKTGQVILLPLASHHRSEQYHLGVTTKVDTYTATVARLCDPKATVDLPLTLVQDNIRGITQGSLAIAWGMFRKGTHRYGPNCERCAKEARTQLRPPKQDTP